jgi:outer membrane protein OmpA-like peptidoglycan-associated protein
MKARAQSTLHLQMGQETLYLLLTSAIFATIVLIAYVAYERRHYEDPPIVTLREADGFYFRPGSSQVSPRFAHQLKARIAPRLKMLATRYDARTIEVIGHTDEVPVGRTGANLDQTLVEDFIGKPGREPIPADNAGLGLARAVAVARALRSDGVGDGFVIVPLSAGPFLKPDDKVTGGGGGADESRRRIEIRLRRPHRR